jgi:hypothetical protein
MGSNPLNCSHSDEPSPVVGGAAGLHDHVGLRDQRVNESFELAPREALTIDDASGPIGKGHLEHVFGKIDGDGRCVHDISSPMWLLLSLASLRGCLPR